jgi:putative transcriptional regulator
MKNKGFKELLDSIGQARKIHAGKLKASRVTKFNPFAHMIGVSIDTLQNWEQGRRRPDGPALALLKVADINPRAVIKALHV